MKALKYIAGIVAATVIALGVVTYIQAKDDSPTQTGTFIYKWYALQPASVADPEALVLISSQPMEEDTPQPSDEEGCAQDGNEGTICAVLVEFESTASDFELDGATLAEAIDENEDAIRVASGVPAEDLGGDGYARSPEPEDE